VPARRRFPHSSTNRPGRADHDRVGLSRPAPASAPAPARPLLVRGSNGAVGRLTVARILAAEKAGKHVGDLVVSDDGEQWTRFAFWRQDAGC